MLGKIVRLVGGNPHQKILDGLAVEVEVINALETEYEGLSEDELKGKTDHFRTRLAKGETLDDILPDAFAAVRETSKRMIGQRHYDVQMIGGIAMHRCFVAEMLTGEGKTLGATEPRTPIHTLGPSGSAIHVPELRKSKPAFSLTAKRSGPGRSTSFLRSSSSAMSFSRSIGVMTRRSISTNALSVSEKLLGSSVILANTDFGSTQVNRPRHKKQPIQATLACLRSVGVTGLAVHSWVSLVFMAISFRLLVLCRCVEKAIRTPPETNSSGSAGFDSMPGSLDHLS